MHRTCANTLHVLDDKLYLRRHAYSTRIRLGHQSVTSIEYVFWRMFCAFSVNSFHLWGFFAKAPPPRVSHVVSVESVTSMQQDPTAFAPHTLEWTGVTLVGRGYGGKLLWQG